MQSLIYAGSRRRAVALSLGPLALLALASVVGLCASASGQCEIAKLLASDGFEFDQFGVDVALSADYAVVGAFKDDSAGDDAGSAHVFTYDGTSWIKTDELFASDAAQSDHFGTDVAISADVIVVAAKRNDDAGLSSGSAYVFRHEGARWVEKAKLVAADAMEGDEFGSDVSVDGDLVVVGAVADDDAGPNSGSAYVFRRQGTNWVEEAKLTASDGASGDNFGISVSTSGDFIAVGARNDDDMGNDSGSVYVFRRDKDTWIQDAKLHASDGEASAKFGSTVAIQGDTIVVGAYLHGFNNPGSAYVFRRVGDAWIEEASLVPSDLGPNDNFGFSVAISGDTVLVGSWIGGPGGPGSAYVFRREGGDWVELIKLTASDGASGDRFGVSVGVSGDVAIVGAFQDDDNGNDSGSAYLFAGVTGVDCNKNGEADACDIFKGTSLDTNGNGIPDECEIFADIKPGACPNSFNRNSHGVLTVALVGTDSFDPIEVDLSTVELSRADGVGGSVAPNEGPPGPHSEFEDMATPFDGQLCGCHEVEGDGITDLSVKFRSDDLVAALELDDLPAGDLVELVVSGMLLDGTEFSASDCIRLVPPGTPPGMMAVGSTAPGVFIDVSPLDLQLDGGGFANFERTFPLGSVVTLTAPQEHQGRLFVGWNVTSVLPLPRSAGLDGGTSIDIMILGDQQTIEAIYEAPSSVLQPPARRLR